MKDWAVFQINYLNNRDVAVITWAAVLFIYVFYKSGIRLLISFFGVLKSAFNKKILPILVLYATIFILLIQALRNVGIWNPFLWKEAVVWIMTAGLAFLFTAEKAYQDEEYFKKIIVKLFALEIFISFFINIHVFSLHIEMLLMPAIFIVAALLAVSELRHENQQVTLLFRVVLAGITLVLIFSGIAHTIERPEEFFTYLNLIQFFLPVLLTIVYMPFIYLFALVMVYENIFGRLSIWFNKPPKTHLKFQILYCCHLNAKKAHSFYRFMIERHVRTEEDLFEALNTFQFQNM